MTYVSAPANGHDQLPKIAADLARERAGSLQEKASLAELSLKNYITQRSHEPVDDTYQPQTQFEIELRRDMIAQERALVAKNRSYGNSALDPVRIFSGASPLEQLRVRIDDKLSRIARGVAYPGDNDIDDLIGYLFLLKMAMRRYPQESA